MAVCSGTKRSGDPCTQPVMPGEPYCYNHHPDYAEDRKRSASKAATAKHSQVHREIREVRELVREIVEVLVSGELNPRVKRELTNVTQLLQTYARLAELEIAAAQGAPDQRLRSLEVALPADLPERAQAQAEEADRRERHKDELLAWGKQLIEKGPVTPPPTREG